MVADLDHVEATAFELYRLFPADFVAARNARADAARAAGDRGLAAALARLRRPTTSAWAINLLVREQRAVVAQLAELGDHLREAQTTLRGPELSELDARRQQVVGELARSARRLAEAAGHPLSPGAAYEVEQTLSAVLADPHAARAVLSGRLEKPLSYTGFGPSVGPLELPDRRRRTAPEDSAAPPRTSARERLVAALAQAREAAGAAAERYAEEDRRLQQARTDRRAAEERIAWLRGRTAKAEAALRARLRAEQEAESSRDAAQRERGSAQRKLDALTARLEETTG